MLHDADTIHANGLAPSAEAQTVLGRILSVSGDAATATLDPSALARLAASDDITLQTAGQVGVPVKTLVRGRWVVANVKAVELAGETSAPVAALDFLGEGWVQGGAAGLGDFRRGITHHPAPGNTLYSVTSADLEEIYAARDRAHVAIGSVYPTEHVSAALFIDPLLSRHFALLGSTGTGKSTTAALLLRGIIEQAPQGHVLMLDPHGEYAAAFADVGQVYDVSNLHLPYWLMNFEEHVEVLVGQRSPEREPDVDILQRCLLAARQKSRLAGAGNRITVDTPVPYTLAELLSALSAQMGKLDKPEKITPYLRLKTKLEELKADPRYSFMFSGLQINDTLATLISELLRMPADGRPVSIIDLSGVPSDITNVVVALISRLVFDFAVWTPQQERRPILLVCEEAHRYVPAERLDIFGSARKNLERIAKEGRKYGVALGLISQRPSDLSEAVLSQCGTIISMRLNNERDQLFVRSAMSEGARGFLDAIPSLRNRECIVCGEGAAVPMRVRIASLAPEHCPASDDPVFSASWTTGSRGLPLIEDAVQRWRTQRR
ncbi:MAG TPA: DUF87 domain-containing protein [Pedomonas sp.]|uniref:ATP-binding protein n=1 Tax=Pedomonas sp. TaxID=2976421 RepID=UPI002F425D4B